MSFARTVIISSLFVFYFFGFSGSSVYAQQSIDELPALTAEELQQIIGAQQGGDSSSQLPYSPYDFSAGASGIPFEGSGGGVNPLLMNFIFAYGNYVWILIALYILLLLFVVFLLYASVFKIYKKFSREQAMVFAWNAAKKHFWFFVLVTLVQVIVYVLLFILFLFLFDTAPNIPQLRQSIPYAGFLAAALVIAMIFFFVLFILGTTKIALKITDGQRAGLKDLFIAISYAPKFIAGFVVYALMIIGPYLALAAAVYFLKNTLQPLQLVLGTAFCALILAIPVSHLIIRFWLYSFVIIDKGAWPVRALKLAGRLSTGARADLALFLMLLFGINWAASYAVPFALGVFLSGPVTALAFTHAYRQLEKVSD